MKNFKVVQGGYREPQKSRLTASRYLEAQVRLLERFQNSGEELNAHEELKKVAFLAVKGKVKSGDEVTFENAEQMCSEYGLIFTLLSKITIRELMQMFPISKIYDGKKYGVKDYFYTRDILRQKELDEPIGNEAFELLSEYENDDIRLLCVGYMMALGKIHVLQGGKDPLDEFLSEQGIASYSYYENEGIMINQETGEISKVQKPAPRIPKYMKVIDGGLK